MADPIHKCRRCDSAWITDRPPTVEEVGNDDEALLKYGDENMRTGTGLMIRAMWEEAKTNRLPMSWYAMPDISEPEATP